MVTSSGKNANLKEIISFLNLMKDITSDNYEEIKKIRSKSPKQNNEKEDNIVYKENEMRLRTEMSNTPKRQTSENHHSDRSKIKQNINTSWVTKIASGVQDLKQNFKNILSQYDTDNDGRLTPYELKTCLLKLNLRLNEDDIDNMLTYYNLNSQTHIEIDAFSKVFLYNK